MADDKDYAIVLMEQMRDELRAVHEAVGGIQEQLADVPKRDEFDELRRDVKTTMSALRDVSGQVADHETRISALEAA
jgi:predicted  nucleic acid-binding Zn-ribbon protein